jgi:hypothetical protein
VAPARRARQIARETAGDRRLLDRNRGRRQCDFDQRAGNVEDDGSDDVSVFIDIPGRSGREHRGVAVIGELDRDRLPAVAAELRGERRAQGQRRRIELAPTNEGLFGCSLGAAVKNAGWRLAERPRLAFGRPPKRRRQPNRML